MIFSNISYYDYQSLCHLPEKAVKLVDIYMINIKAGEGACITPAPPPFSYLFPPYRPSVIDKYPREISPPPTARSA